MVFIFSIIVSKFKNLKNIKILATDVDCVLTDCGMYYTSEGDYMKKFHTRDGMGIALLRKCGISTIIVTKEKIIEKICSEYKVKNEEVAYIGDDVNDLGLLKKVGFSATPNDGILDAQNIVDYVCKKKGGDGVLREVADLILHNND